VLTGRELDALDQAHWAGRAVDVDIFARTTPEHKLKLVEALQSRSKIVAMTGDGVNDAPALKRADIGVAMGRRGTEAAKEASQMVLADDNFATITHAVEEGRAVYDTLKKAIMFILPTNGGEALVLLVAIAFGLTLPITPLQILWINMITAVTLALALAFEPAEQGLMARPPRDPRMPLLSPVLLWRIVWIAMLMTVVSLGLFAYSQHLGWALEASRSLAVNAMVACEIGYLFSSRSLYGPARFGWRDNPMIWAMVLVLSALQLALTYWPPLQGLFAMAALPVLAWAWCLGTAVGVCALVELEKYVLRRLRA
jgi:magnesium-transporting ATPase (P-type)